MFLPNLTFSFTGLAGESQRLEVNAGMLVVILTDRKYQPPHCSDGSGHSPNPQRMSTFRPSQQHPSRVPVEHLTITHISAQHRI